VLPAIAFVAAVPILIMPAVSVEATGKSDQIAVPLLPPYLKN